MNLAELRDIAYGRVNASGEMTMSAFMESVSLIDEAYFGTKPIQKIKSAMDDIYLYVMAHPNEALHGTPVAAKLEEAIQDTFGFKKVKIYWGNRANGGNPYTIPNATVFHMDSSSFQYGRNSKGFYDDRHELKLYIQMDQTLFTEANLTSDEAMAILLHEIGHNFDYSPARIISVWFDIINIFMGNANTLINYLAGTLISEFGQEAYQTIRNIDTLIGAKIPPIAKIVHGIHSGIGWYNKIFTAIVSPLTIAINVPAAVVLSPISYLQRFKLRKGEVYADSFAASYGYGDDLAIALEKLTNAKLTFENTNNPIVNIFGDIAKLQSEILGLFYGGHGSNQKRLIKIRDKLQKDLMKSNLTPEIRKEIEEDLKSVDRTYDQLMNIDKAERDTLTHAFRRMVDSWYGGKPYIAIKSFSSEYAE